MTKYVIDQTKLGVQKISNATLREVDELDKEMKNIYEITFVVKIREDGVLHNGIVEAQLQDAQKDQVFLGIREGSVQAFWTDTDGRRRIRNDQNLQQAEYVEVNIFNIQHFEIRWMFNKPERVASHFEFEFKILAKVKPDVSCFRCVLYQLNLNLELETYQDLEFATIDITKGEKIKFSLTRPTDLHACTPYISENQNAGNPYAQMRKNPKFQLTSAEIHVISYYGSQNESEKILCIVSSEFGVAVHRLDKSSTIGDLRSLIVRTGEHKDKYLMIEEKKRPYRADKKLSDFGSNYGLNDGCIFFRFQKNNT